MPWDPILGGVGAQERKVRLRTLAAVMLVSKAVSGHAVEVLWETLPSLVPVLKVLPNFKRSSPGTVCALDKVGLKSTMFLSALLKLSSGIHVRRAYISGIVVAF